MIIIAIFVIIIKICVILECYYYGTRIFQDHLTKALFYDLNYFIQLLAFSCAA